MNDRNYGKLAVPIIIFTTVIIVFLVKLKKLNIFLIEYYNNKSSFDLITYNNCEPVKFFFGALILSICGLFLIYYYINLIKTLYLEFVEIIIVVILIIGIGILIILIIITINIPIFQAILSVCFTFGAIVMAASNSN